MHWCSTCANWSASCDSAADCRGLQAGLMVAAAAPSIPTCLAVVSGLMLKFVNFQKR